MIDLKIHLVFGGGVGDGTYPVVIAVVIWAAHIQIRQRKCLHHLERRWVDEVSRHGRKLITSAIQFGIARALIGCQVVEGNKPGTHWTAGIGVVDAGIGVPQLPFRVVTPAGAVESRPTNFTKVATAHGGAGDAHLYGVCNPLPRPFVINKEKRLVLSDGSAGVDAKLVIAASWQLDAASIVEPVIGRQYIVAHELPGASMEGVGPGADDHIDRCGATKAGGVGAEVGLNLELLHSIH